MFMVALAATFTFVSCDPETDEKAGGTAVEKMAGLWEVTVDVVDEQGNVLGKDPLGLGTINITLIILQQMMLIRCGLMMIHSKVLR